jgi:hypothetical protein
MLLSPNFNSHRSTDGLNIAVILAGQVRTMDYCLPKLRGSFDGPHTTSYFMSTWDNNEHSAHHGLTNSSTIYKPSSAGPSQMNARFLQDEKFQFADFTIEDFDALTAKHQKVAEETISIIPQDQKDKAHKNELESKALVIALNQLYLLKKGYELVRKFEKTNGLNFDIIVRARPDIIFKNRIVWPNSGEIVTDCLRFSRRRKHFLFDGYFAGAPSDVAPVLNGYDAYFKQLECKVFFAPYISKLKIRWPFGHTSHRRLMGSNGRHSVLRSERFCRYLLAQQKDCVKIDTRVGVKIVRHYSV